VTRVTADSNIYISALMFGGKPLQLLEMALDGEVELAISEAILTETLRVLRDKFHRTPDQLQDAERFITAITRHVSPTEPVDAVPTDPDDNRVLECAAAARSAVVVSGDADLLRLGSFRGASIQKPADFLAGFQARRG
jgi:putative PIN family toxin of toxin-antitoxin system